MSTEAIQTERDRGSSTLRRGVVDVTGVKLADLEDTLRGEDRGRGNVHLERQNGRTFLVTERSDPVDSGTETSGDRRSATARVEIIDLRE